MMRSDNGHCRCLVLSPPGDDLPFGRPSGRGARYDGSLKIVVDKNVVPNIFVDCCRLELVFLGCPCCRHCCRVSRCCSKTAQTPNEREAVFIAGVLSLVVLSLLVDCCCCRRCLLMRRRLRGDLLLVSPADVELSVPHQTKTTDDIGADPQNKQKNKSCLF
jgi:hypothetical protein